jgi:hypothetical protein
MKDIVEITRLYLNDIPGNDDIELLNDFIGLRTSAIVMGLGKVKQYGTKNRPRDWFTQKRLI